MEEFLHRLVEPFQYKYLLIPRAKHNQARLIRMIQTKGEATVVFIVSSLPMWRFQGLFDKLVEDKRFHPYIVLYPFPTFSQEEKDSSIAKLKDYFRGASIPLLDLSTEKNPGLALRTKINPDVIFYPQPYNNLFYNDLDSKYFEDKLLCYIPYAMLTAKGSWAYKNRLNNVAWKVYFQSESRKEEACRVLFNKGENIVVSGEPMADLFSNPSERDVWKQQEKNKKRIIWAPHFSLSEEELLHRDSFLWMSDAMWDLANKYKDSIQFAFKPHPKLLSVLYELPSWGKERADAYFKRWTEESNTQLETGNYIELFKGSDAMIHDCGSFSVEYHFTGKPVMFISSDVSKTICDLNEFGQEAILVHYQGKTIEDIEYFIENVVIQGADPKLQNRINFRRKYLDTPGTQSVADNIYHNLIESLGL